MEIVVTIGLISLIIYLRYYADLRTEWEKETERVQEGIKQYNEQHFDQALQYFNQRLQTHPNSAIAYLYRARCLQAMGDADAAFNDLKKAASFDGSIPELHVELGKAYYNRQEYPTALRDFNKAVHYAHGELASAYHWRGLTLQQLQQPEQAQHDLQKAEAITERHRMGQPVRDLGRRAFFDHRLLYGALGVIANGILLLYVVKITPVIHYPYMLAAATAAIIGFIEPRKGWVLAILQVATIWLGYTYFTSLPQQSGKRELELFGLYGSIILTFAGSFIGGVLKRQLQKPTI